MRLNSHPGELVDINGRLIVSSIMAVVLYSSFFNRFKNYYHDLLQIAAWVFIGHLYYVSYLNDLSPYYTYSTYYIIFAVSLIIQTRASLFAFFAYTFAAATFAALGSGVQVDYQYILLNHVNSLGLVFIISYIAFSYREKFIHEAYVSHRVQEIVNHLLELLLTDITFERTLKKSISTLQEAPWFERTSPIAIYLVSDERMRFKADNGMFNRVPFNKVNKDKYDITLIKSPKGTLGALVTFKEENFYNINDKDRLNHLRSIADSLGILIRRQQKEKIIKRQQMQLTQSAKLVALGEMAGGVAHEINTPLTVISNHIFNLKTMQEMGVMDINILNSSLEKIDSTVQRIASIVRGLQNMSRDGSLDKMKPTSIQEIVYEAFSMCEERFKSRGVEFIKPQIPKNLVVMCRKVEIAQVLVNLLNNASDAIENSTVKQIAIKVKDLEDNIEISVIDSGPGVPESIQDKLFHPFFTTKAVGKGTGLGLSISHGIINHHLGELFYSDKSGRSEFVISLPKPKNITLAS
ncbi:MAG: hypothetical protein H6625_09020 [Bdellovibrionaceae bacterium]|nr:hypothetical protein [Pseudobdellovibrionaceae bacterium]